MLYLWIKWLHILAIVSWMAGILYLYRLLINHREKGHSKPEVHHLLMGMEYRLSRYITFPAMIVSVVCGFALGFMAEGFLQSSWFWLKVVFVLGLIASTIYADKLRILAATRVDAIPSPKSLRWLNEVPTMLMAVIVWLVLFKP